MTNPSPIDRVVSALDKFSEEEIGTILMGLSPVECQIINARPVGAQEFGCTCTDPADPAWRSCNWCDNHCNECWAKVPNPPVFDRDHHITACVVCTARQAVFEHIPKHRKCAGLVGSAFQRREYAYAYEEITGLILALEKLGADRADLVELRLLRRSLREAQLGMPGPANSELGAHPNFNMLHLAFGEWLSSLLRKADREFRGQKALANP